MNRTAFQSMGTQFLFGASLFTSILFIPNYATHILGASDFQVGLIVFAYAASGFVSSYFFGRMADVRGRSMVLRIGFGLSCLASLVQILPFDPWTLLASRAFVGISAGMVPPALLAFAYDAHIPMGRFASVGSLGWGAGALLAGAVTSLPVTEAGGVRIAFALSAALFAAGFLVILRTTFPRHVALAVPLFSAAVMRRNLPVFLSILIRHTGASMIWVIFPVFLEDDIHLSKGLIGILYLVNTATQFLVMPLMDRMNAEKLVAWGLVLSSLTFMGFTLADGFWQILPTQLLLGFSWSGVYVGSLKQVMEDNVERATAAGLLGSSMNLSQGLGPLAGGLVAHWLGRREVMYVAAGLALLALVAYLVSSGKTAPRRGTV